MPRSRDGSFSTELFERYQRSEKALVLALMEMVVNGVSTRKVKNITTEPCGREFSKSTVSELAKGLAEQVTAWNERSLEGTAYTFVLVDAMHIEVRRQGAVRSTSALERLIEEVRRREKVIRIFLSEESAWRLLGAFLAERHEEWSSGRRYLKMDEYFEWKENYEPETPAAQAAA